jgi:hypothetical protein
MISRVRAGRTGRDRAAMGAGCAWLAGLALGLAGCSAGEVPLAANPLAAEARTADYPRPASSSLPADAAERTFGDRCGIEAIQGATVSEAMPDGSFRVDLPAVARGWAFPPDEAPGIPDAWLRFLPVGEGTAAEFPIVLHYARPDVVAARANPRAAFSGFTEVTVTGLVPGTYHVQVVFASGAGRWTCTQVRAVHVQ